MEIKRDNEAKHKKKITVFLFGLFFIFFASFLTADISWKENISSINFTLEEDSSYKHNFTENLSTFVEGDLLFEIVDEGHVMFNGERILFSSLDWISFNTTSGVMEFNSVGDNQTGFLEIPVLAANNKKEGPSILFKFEINAVNDVPEFVNFNDSISRYTQGDLNITFSAIDEEEHYPLNFAISFNNCSLASGGGDCNLNYSWEIVLGKENTSSVLTFENLTRENKGKYNITVCVNDSLSEENLPEYRREDYNMSKQSCQDFILDLRSPLTVTDINCSNIFTIIDNETRVCQILIETEFENSSLDISSISGLVNSSFNLNIANNSWFYPSENVVSEGYEYLVNVLVSPGQKVGVGNWTINFTVNDVSDLLDETSSPVTINIPLFVNRSSNFVPNISRFGDKKSDFLFDSSEEIVFRVKDEDLLVPDKGVYREYLSINFSFFNEENSSRIFSGNYNFSMSEWGDSDMEISFYPNPAEEDVGFWKVNVSAMDASGEVGFFEFNLTISDNTPPWWERSLVNISCIVPANKDSGVNCTYFNEGENMPFDIQSLNFSNNSNGINWASDSEQTNLIYSLVGTSPRNFNLTSEGFLNFTAWKEDVGWWDFEVLVSDGVLSNSSRWLIQVNNTNSIPNDISLFFSVDSLNWSGVNLGGVVNVPQSKEIGFLLNVVDEDFLVPNFSENLSTKIVFKNSSSGEVVENFFNFSFLSEDNKTFSSSFIPLREDIGEYEVSINISDSFGASAIFNFLLNISILYSPPEIFEVFNQSSAVNRSFVYSINATDVEGGNLIYSYFLLSEVYSGRNTSNQEIFNRSSFENTGKFNLTFNESDAGVYVLNVSARSDISNLSDSKIFWIFVYDTPKVLFPENGFSFSGLEGNSSIFNFSANHSVGNDLVYEVYFNRVYCLDEFNCVTYPSGDNKKGEVVGLGDGIERVLIPVEFDYGDEDYGITSKYLKLFVYPSDVNLENSRSLGKTVQFTLNVNHSNSPINFTKVIGSFSRQHTETVNISLSEHFEDVDSSDKFYNQNLEFEIVSDSEEGSDLLVNGVRLVKNFVLNVTSLDDFVLEFGCREGVVSLNESLVVIGYDLDEEGNRLTNVSSNEFVAEFYRAPEIIKTITTSTSRSVEVPFFMKLVVPGQISGALKESIVIPLEIINSGKSDLREINLFAEFESEKDFSSSVSMQFSESFFEVLRVGERKEVFLTVNKGSDVVGEYAIFINASSKNPKYSDWGRVQVILPEVDSFLERIIFAETFISENYECLEIREVTSRARNFYEEAKYDESLREANLAIDACRIILKKDFVSLDGIKTSFEDKFFRYFVFSLGISFFAGISIYLYRRNKLKFVGD